MTYDFECPKCGYTFEKWYSKIMPDPETTKPLCEKCGEMSKRLISLSTVLYVDGPLDKSPWMSKEIRRFGAVPGAEANAEKCRLRALRKQEAEEKEKSFYSKKR